MPNPKMNLMQAPWYWSGAGDRHVLFCSDPRRSVVLSCQDRTRGAEIVVCDEEGMLVPITPEHPVAMAIVAMPDLLAIARMAVKVALTRPHDGNQLDEDLEGLLLCAKEALERAGVKL
jgi:hypothetical protein